MSSPDLSLLATQFREFGGPIFGKRILTWNLRNLGIQVRTNVKAPQSLMKLSAKGQPRPYGIADNFEDGVGFSERVITAYQSKQDWSFDPEAFRNTILANAAGSPFYEQCLNQNAKEYLDKIIRLTLYGGVRNGAGTGPADICDGWGTIIDRLIAGTDTYGNTLTPIATGAIDSTNAVEAVDTMKSGAPTWMRDSEEEVLILCGWKLFDDYAIRYRTKNGFKFEPRVTRDYAIDNTNMILRPTSILPATSQRLIMTVKDNLVFGTDKEAVTIHATPYLNYLKIRNLMPGGCEIQDTDALFVNDQA
jgi:hypothetical protein